MKKMFLIVILITINHFVDSLSLELNDTCDVARTKTKGICKFIENCEILVKEIREESLFPAVCGFVRDKVIICCPIANMSAEISANPIRKSVKSEFESNEIRIGICC